MIKKQDGKYVVTDSTGTKKLGTHDTYNKAMRQLAAIEHAKKARKEK